VRSRLAVAASAASSTLSTESAPDDWLGTTSTATLPATEPSFHQATYDVIYEKAIALAKKYGEFIHESIVDSEDFFIS
jgi:hypothetical protein